MRLTMATVIFWLLVVTSALGYGERGGEGGGEDGTGGGDGYGCGNCSSADSLYENTISNLAVSLGENADEAKEVFDDMVKRRYSDLYLVKESKEPCQLYDQCGSLGSELVNKIAESAMKYQEFDSVADRVWWDNLHKVLLLILGVITFFLALANRFWPRN